MGAGGRSERDAVPARRVDGRGDGAGVPIEPLARYFEYWLLRLQGVYQADPRAVATRRGRFWLRRAACSPFGLGATCRCRRGSLRELEAAHRALIAHAPREGSEVGAGAARDATILTTMTFQSLILKLSEFWASRGCALQQPLDVEVGAGTMHPETFLRVLGPGALERRLRAAVAPAGRRPLRREPEPPVQAPPVPGDPQAGARRGAAAVSREPRGVRHQPAAARHPLRGGQLGVADARRLGHRLAGDVRRHGDHAVHLLPAGRRHRAGADLGRADLRPRAHRDGRCSAWTACTTSSGRRA